MIEGVKERSCAVQCRAEQSNAVQCSGAEEQTVRGERDAWVMKGDTRRH